MREPDERPGAQPDVKPGNSGIDDSVIEDPDSDDHEADDLGAEAPEPPEGGPLVTLVPTPIGNLRDITLRALETLRAADAVAAEDTRHSRKLLAHYGIRKPLVRLDAHTIRERGPAALRRYPRLAYVTDAGTPGLSDPGQELVRVALEAGGRAEALPGPNALLPALVLSGLPAARFAFHGFLPRSGRERRERILEVAASTITIALYESPRRLASTLRDLAAACGPDRPCAVARELSKLHEEVFRGNLAEAAARFGTDVRGEIVLVVGARPDEPPADDREPERFARELAVAGEPARAIRERLEALGLDRNRAYRVALEAVGASRKEPE